MAQSPLGQLIRKNTLSFDLKNLPSKVSSLELQVWLLTTFNFEPTAVIACSIDSYLKRFFLKLATKELVDTINEKTQGCVQFTLENISYDIEVQIADEQATTIVIYSVPIELPDS